MELTADEKLVILRGADDLIGQGGRTLLAKVLKGSRDKKVLEHELDQSPVYGHFKEKKIADIVEMVDWMIEHDFLDIEYFGKLPMIVYTERGWKIEANQRADEFLREWDQWIEEGRSIPDMDYLKGRNREMILLLLDKIKETGNRKYTPFLEAWEEVDYKKVRAAIRDTIASIESEEPIDWEIAQKREEEIKDALKGAEPQDLLLKCWDCGERFTFTAGEQRLFKQKGFDLPRRCVECRDRRKYGLEFDF
jgi:superfamily II DNA helicase RecQ